jgi:hypothetical protein
MHCLRPPAQFPRAGLPFAAVCACRSGCCLGCTASTCRRDSPTCPRQPRPDRPVFRSCRDETPARRFCQQNRRICLTGSQGAADRLLVSAARSGSTASDDDQARPPAAGRVSGQDCAGPAVAPARQSRSQTADRPPPAVCPSPPQGRVMLIRDGPGDPGIHDYDSGNATPVSFSDSSQSRRAAARSCAVGAASTSTGCPLYCFRPLGP